MMTTPTSEKANADGWWQVLIHCKECGKPFLRKVKGQRYCDEHRHLGGAVIRPMSSAGGSRDGNV